jgi:hypothetical protein
MTNAEFFSIPLEEKKAVYWVPPSTFDPVTKGRELSAEEKRILRKLDPLPSIYRDAFDSE